MSIEYKNDDFLLQLEDNSPEVLSVINKYDSFLDALTTSDFEHVREAVKKAVMYFITKQFSNTEQTAVNTYNKNEKLKAKYGNLTSYLEHIKIKDRRSYSIDLATGTGKSWVIYGVAMIMLAEGLVDKVLVLCPSLTIEEELKKKFEKFSGDSVLTKILKELTAVYSAPSIKSANDPILNGDICIENIHAAYQRTGSSIPDSFKDKGQRTLVISDEAHHIYSKVDAGVKKWFEFITSDDYEFHYLLGLTGTPYINDEYFHDVIYRFSIRQAIEKEIVKSINYKVEEDSDKDKGFDETYANHLKIQKEYTEKLKPITIIVTDKIVTCMQVWDQLVRFLSEKENIEYKEAASKVIWVTSGLPSNKNEKSVIEGIFSKPEKSRKENLNLLKTVDDETNPVEWIVSVSMLTEGWDVKNVFQIVPHEQRAFNSKLLISQVLGRGLRIPAGLKPPVRVTINNHEKWTQNIKNLYNEVLEIENRISWGYDCNRSDFLFPLYNFDYIPVQDTVESKKQLAKFPEKIKLDPQSITRKETSIYSETGTSTYEISAKETKTIEEAAREIKLFLKDKDETISKQWPIRNIEDFIKNQLDDNGYDSSFVSKSNLTKVKTSFGPLFRELDKETPRMKMKPDTFKEIKVEEFKNQYFNESSIKNNGYLFYCSESMNSHNYEQQKILEDHFEGKERYHEIKENISKYANGNTGSVDYLINNLYKIESREFKTPLNLIYVSYTPELKFTKSLFNNTDLVDSFIKAPDKGFYFFPYSYKPSDSSHVHNDNFNPDFFVKLTGKNEILVIEIKADGDSTKKNQAKYRDADAHFKHLNTILEKNSIYWTYFFYFLSPNDITEFFQSIRDKRYISWKSGLMQELRS
jgi:type III restriction enzyme